MTEKKSILTTHPVTGQTEPNLNLPKVGWDVDKFESLIYRHGYEAYIERAMRCPCVDKATGQALSTCKNCLGRGWFFVDRRETRLVAQGMNNSKKIENWSEVNHGIARITTRAIDKLGFMDRIILLDLEAYYSEILKPVHYENELVAYPIYEPLKITDIYLYAGDTTKLIPIPEEMYEVKGNRIVFDDSLEEFVPVEDMNQKHPDISITIRYSYNPVYHILDANRELTKVRERKCSFSDETLRKVPMNYLAKKAHFIFDNQTYGNSLIDNSIVPHEEDI